MLDHDARTPELSVVQASYGALASLYVERVGSVEAAPVEDRAVIDGWADTVRGPVLDAGCGPGHWSGHLHRRGVAVSGVDATPEFIERARSAEPEVPFRLDDLHGLDLEDRSLGGVLAWFSLIHMDPTAVPRALGAFAAALRPGGSLLVGFFSGDDLQPFDHRVVTAWAWPLALMSEAIGGAGLEVRSERDWPTPNGRRHAAVVAIRPS